jgi:hypothetical protein
MIDLDGVEFDADETERKYILTPEIRLFKANPFSFRVVNPKGGVEDLTAQGNGNSRI